MIKIIEISAKSKLFPIFYDSVYLRAFPDKNEREPAREIRKGLGRTITAESELVENAREPSSRKVAGSKTNHCLLALRGKEVIAGTIFDFFKCHDGSCFGVGWWIAVKPEHRRKKVGTRLVKETLKTLEKDAKKSKCRALNGFIMELNNPRKMIKYGFPPEKDSINPYGRIKFWKKFGSLRVKGFDYIQLTSDPKRFVEYCDLYIIPSKKGKWRSGYLRRGEVMKIISYFASLGSGHKNLLKDKPFLKMMRSASKSRKPFKLA